MVDIRPNQLPDAILPLRETDELVVDQGADGVRKAPPIEAVNSVVPVASQADAVAGSDNTKRMTPLRTKQSIASEVGVTLASNSQGEKADSAVQTVNGKSGNSVTLVKGDVGLGNVDNTSDANKPISTATQNALDAKANSSVTISAGTGLTGGGSLTANRTVSLNAASIASLAKADSAVQTVNGAAPVGGDVTVSAEEKRLQDTRTTAMAESFGSNVLFVETAGYSSVGDGGGALYKRVSSEPTHPGKFQSADGAWWELAEIDPLPQVFGAKGDGITDDTVAVQNWVDFPNRIKTFRGGVFLSNDQITLSLSGVRIVNGGATLLAGTVDIYMFYVTGNNCDVSMNVDGNDLAAEGVYVRGSGCRVYSCRVTNMHGHDLGAVGIHAYNATPVQIFDNYITNITADANGTIGDNAGSSRAILVNGDTAASRHSVVKDNYIDNITGEEGDAIQIAFVSGATVPYLNARCDVIGNTIRNANRRSIKIQASMVNVKGNSILNTLTSANAPNLTYMIDVIYPYYAQVEDNTIFTSEAPGIQMQGVSGTPAYSNKISGNTISVPSDAGLCMSINWLVSSIIKGNTFINGTKAINVGNSIGCIFEGNTLIGGTGVGIDIGSSCSKIVAKGNTSISGTRTSVVSLAAPDSIAIDNVSYSGAAVNATATATGSLTDRNINSSGLDTFAGTGSAVMWGSSLNIGSGGGGVGGRAITWGTSIPSTQFPSRTFSAGDIVFARNASASGKIGWVCVASGTPGTWKAFGPIDA